MEVKKTAKADLQNKLGIMLEVGLIVALLIVIAAFLYTPKEREVQKIDLNYGPQEEEIVEITRQEQKPPEAPKKTEINVINDFLNVVTNDTKIESKIEFNEWDDEVEIVSQVAVAEEVVEEDAPFVKVEQMPSFMGGDLMKFRNWVSEKLRYPAIAQENGISGRVIVEFVIEKDGSLTNIKTLQSPDPSLSDEAVRVLKSSPKWTPGKQRNQAVRVKYTLPVDFRINN